MMYESEELFIPYEQAVALKELGFDKPCFFPFYQYSDRIDMIYADFSNWNARETLVSAPLFDQVFDWFREKYNLNSWIENISKEYVPKINEMMPKTLEDKYGSFLLLKYPERYFTHRDAKVACVEKLIEIVKLPSATTD